MMLDPERQHLLRVRDYDLAATLTSGQAFRWREREGGCESVVNGRWLHLSQGGEGIIVQTAQAVSHWDWLEEYLQAGVDLASILLSFPEDEPMHVAVTACRGLRLLRQE